MRVTREELLRLFTYDPSEPLALRWKVTGKGASQAKVGDIAGHWRPMKWGSPTAIRNVGVGKIIIPVHRAVWLMVKGEDPPKKLGFRNGDTGDCRIENLVEPTRQTSVVEARKIRDEAPRVFTYADPEKDWSETLRRKHLQRTYYINRTEYDRLFDAQGGVCAICKRPERMVRHGKLGRLSVDHCHETDVVRGLLCTNCNNGIGRLEDNPVWLRAAADYLEKPRALRPAPKQISLFDEDTKEAAD